MAKLTQSYAHGVSMTPLIGDTIGVHFDQAVARWADRDALIVRQQNIRWTYGEIQDPALHQICRCVSDNGDRQGAEVPDARGNDQGIGPERTKNGISGSGRRASGHPPSSSRFSSST